MSLTEKHLGRILNQLTIHFEKQIKCDKLNKNDENATNISVFMVVFLWFKDLSSNYFVHYLRIPNRDGTNHFVDRVRLMYLVIQPLRIRTVCCIKSFVTYSLWIVSCLNMAVKRFSAPVSQFLEIIFVCKPESTYSLAKTLTSHGFVVLAILKFDNDV